MKKLLLILAMLLTLTACAAPEGTLKAPPQLIVTCGETQISAIQGGYGWSYETGKNGDTVDAIADAIHPLDSKLTKEKQLQTRETTATLSFAVEPESFYVECWSDAHWGNTDIDSGLAATDGHTLTLLPGGYIYEIHASWEAKNYSGSASYTVYITSTAEPAVLTGPPALTVKSGGNSTLAKIGTSSWSYETGNGTMASIEADSSHPLILLTAEDRMETTESYATLLFEVPPDRIEAVYWPAKHLGNSEEHYAQPMEPRGNQITLDPGGLIYSIHAYWDDREGYEGDAWYCFYTERT